MKITRLFLPLLIAFAIHTKSQIPNNGFENWIEYGNGLNPEGWWCSNDSVSSIGIYFPVTRSTDHFPANVGEYSIRLSNSTSLLPTWGGMGITWYGGWNGNNNPSFPISGHPNSLCGYYKFLNDKGDAMRIFLVLYNNGIEVAQAEFIDNVTVTDWTPFVIPIPEYEIADSARIMLSSFDADAFQINGNSILFIDNLSFDNLISSVGNNISTVPEFNSFPNPASDYVKIINNSSNFNNLTVNFYSILGGLVKSETINSNQNQFNITNLKNGIYLVEIKTTEITFYKKIIINRAY